jgi:hypothetical protein
MHDRNGQGVSFELIHLFSLWPCFDSKQLFDVLELNQLEWEQASEICKGNATVMTWMRLGEGDELEAFLTHPETAAWLFRSLLTLRLPHLVHPAEATTLLVPPSECVWLKDKFFDIWGLGETLGGYLSAVAKSGGHMHLAAQHAKASLQQQAYQFYHPVKIYHAHAAIAGVLAAETEGSWGL